jgi:hypothetical protein
VIALNTENEMEKWHENIFRDLGFEADIRFSRIRGSKDLHTVPLSRSIGNCRLSWDGLTGLQF